MIPDDTPLEDLNISPRLTEFLKRAVELKLHAFDCDERVYLWRTCNCNWRRVFLRYERPKTFGEVKDVTAVDLRGFMGRGVGPSTIKEWEVLLASTQSESAAVQRQRDLLRAEILVHDRSIRGLEKGIETQRQKIVALTEKLEALG